MPTVNAKNARTKTLGKAAGMQEGGKKTVNAVETAGTAPMPAGTGKKSRRTPSNKKKELLASSAGLHAMAMATTAASPSSLMHPAPFDAHSMAQQLHAFHLAADSHTPEPQAPRLLPDLAGVTPLTAHEIHSDLRAIQSAFAAFQSKVQARVSPPVAHAYASTGQGSALYAHGREAVSRQIDEAYATSSSFMHARRRARANGVITPEEVVESVPVARRAVRITQRELAAMKRERDELERNFMRMRCKLMWQLGEMTRIQRQQQRVLKTLGKDVVAKAKTLESSRRRTNALQDVMNELDARAVEILRLTRNKTQLEAIIEATGQAVPEVDDMYIGDRVTCPFGDGIVENMDTQTRIVTIVVKNGDATMTAYVQEDDVTVRTMAVTLTEAETSLKQRLFDKIGTLVTPNGTISIGRSRRRPDGSEDYEFDQYDRDGELEESDSSDSDSDDESDEDDEDNDGNGEYADKKSKRVEGTDAGRKRVGTDEEFNAAKSSKKRKMMVLSSSSSTKYQRKRQKTGKLLDFTACKLRITPYDTGLLLSPLSTLPENVAAMGPKSLQWLSSYLPSQMAEFEKERYQSLQMRGEIERLRFQLSKAEEERTEAQQLAADQLESINHLVTQMDKLRETLATKEAKEKEMEREHRAQKSTSTPITERPNGDSHQPTAVANATADEGVQAATAVAGGKKTPTGTSSSAKVNGKVSKRASKRARADSSEESNAETKEDATTVNAEEKEAEVDDDSSDHNQQARVVKRTPRSRRGRRGPRTAK